MTNQQKPEALHHTKYLTVVYRDIKPGDEARELIMHPKMTASSWSHVMNERDRLQDENANLNAGYAAARLEIESRQARIKAMAEERADELTVAHLDGRMRGRSTEPTGEYPALPDADRDYMRKVVAVAVAMLFDGYKEDVMRVFSTGELSEFVTITAAMRVEKVEDIYRRAWDLLSLPARASHGQAPAQAAPAAVAGTHVTDAMALAFHSALSDGDLGFDEVEEIKAGLRAALAAAPPPPTTSAGSGKGGEHV